MAGASVLDGTRSVGISDLATHDVFPTKVSSTLHALKTLGNLVTIQLLLLLCHGKSTELVTQKVCVCGGGGAFSPAELLMSRKLRTTLPLVRKKRIPKVPDIKVVQQDDNQAKTKQKKNFNSHHGVYELPELYPGDTVWIKDRQAEGKVIQEIAPRSYVVHTPDGEFQRNRRYLIQQPRENDDKNGENVTSDDKSTGRGGVG